MSYISSQKEAYHIDKHKQANRKYIKKIESLNLLCLQLAIAFFYNPPILEKSPDWIKIALINYSADNSTCQ